MTLIIIVTYNGEVWIKDCIESLINEPDSDIFIIDCGSTDRTKDILTLYKDDLFIYYSSVNLGFGRANNIGLQYANEHSYDYVFLVNQDTICLPGIVQSLVQSHQESNEYGIISPMHFYNDDMLDRNFEDYLRNSSTRVISQILQNQNVVSVDFVNAAFWLIPIDVIKRIGGFDLQFPHYGEDEEYINRVKYINKKIGVNTNSKAFHLRKQSIKINKNIHHWKYYFYKKNLIILKNPLNSVWINFRNSISFVFKNILSSIMSLNYKKFIGLILSLVNITTDYWAIHNKRKSFLKQVKMN